MSGIIFLVTKLAGP